VLEKILQSIVNSALEVERFLSEDFYVFTGTECSMRTTTFLLYGFSISKCI